MRLRPWLRLRNIDFNFFIYIFCTIKAPRKHEGCAGHMDADVLKELFMNVMELHHFYAALDTTPAPGGKIMRFWLLFPPFLAWLISQIKKIHLFFAALGSSKENGAAPAPPRAALAL
jgi:hypothetical protein